MSEEAIDLLFGAGLAGLGPEVRVGVWDSGEASEHARGLAATRGMNERSRACLEALVLLWHDHLDEAHRLVQDLSGADAAFVHGIMHRREPDYSNARYWFLRVGRHGILEALADEAAPLLAVHAALPFRLIRDGLWDTLGFIDAVAAIARHPPTGAEPALLRELQRFEFLVLARHLAGVQGAGR